MQGLTANTIRIIENSSLSRSDKALLRCEVAKELEEAGDYEAARNALGELWCGLGERPNVNGLDDAVEALVLLRVGALTGWLGTARQVGGAQEAAKDLISESLRKFEALAKTSRVVEAQTEMALCYWREGAFDEARVILRDARDRLEGQGGESKNGELKARVLLRSAIVEFKTQRFDAALDFLTQARPLIEASDDDVLKGKLHGETGLTLRHLAAAEKRADYMDRALVEYAASNFHFEQAGHFRYCARGENNLAMLFLTLAKYDEAHEHLDRAHRLFKSLQDTGSAAQVSETRARVYLAEGRNADAERAARESVESLEQGSEQALLAEALRTHGVALARVGRDIEARSALERASATAEEVGDLEGGGQASLIILEELGGHLHVGEMCAVYERADRLLAATENKETITRLRSSARRAMAEVQKLFGEEARPQLQTPKEVSVGDEINYPLPEAVRRYEAELIRRALEANNGSVTGAAQQLGITHQALSAIIHRRHKHFLATRKPRKRRQVSIIRTHREHAGPAGD